MAISSEKPFGQNPDESDAETLQHASVKHRVSNIYTLRIEHATYSTLKMFAEPTSDNLTPLNLSISEAVMQPNWLREFTILGWHTLEQLNKLILNILGWDREHLYEFRIADRVYANLVFLEEDDFFVDAEKPCVSCHMPIKHLGLSVGDEFAYLYDFCDYHIFRITVLDIRPASATEIVPVLLLYRGENIIQHPFNLGEMELQVLRSRAPTVVAPEPCFDKFRVRFIRDQDGLTLREWRASNNKTHWQKAVTILENRDMSRANIASKIEETEGNVERWIKAFNRFGLDGLRKPSVQRDSTKPHERFYRSDSRDLKVRRILEIIHSKPSAYGINRSSWSGKSIAQVYAQEFKETISESHTRYLVKKFGYSIRKARKVLTSPDPNYREKVDLLLNTLQNLKPDERFFFVDELGPLRVKKYGGRALVRKNEALTYPQVQEHRGVIMMSGALSATTNQVTWVYSRAKDTTAMIDLMELLYNQYFSAPKLYVSWDAASWHKSAMLVEWLDAFNFTTRKTNEGPLIELVPLPTSSQFLDVIEAVFSGMKQAVVHHSDYRDATEMKKAISLHFSERNAHFRENPRRAGKKIWEIDFFDDNENIRSGNYREW